MHLAQRCNDRGRIALRTEDALIEIVLKADLERDEIDYLITLENTLKSTLIAAVGALDGVTIADISKVVQGHEYCTSDPWTYGLSVLLVNDDSLAPFHPTPHLRPISFLRKLAMSLAHSFCTE